MGHAGAVRKKTMFKIGDKVQPMDWGFTPDACPTVKAVRVDGACQLDFRAFAGLPPPGVSIQVRRHTHRRVLVQRRRTGIVMIMKKLTAKWFTLLEDGTKCTSSKLADRPPRGKVA